MEADVILIVDDDSAIRQLLRRVLTDKGYTVLTAGHPRKALDLVETRDGTIDLLITDFEMPGMTGVELVERLRAKSFTAPVLIMSSSPNLSYWSRITGASGIDKPFRLSVFVERVRELVGERSQEGGR